MATALRRHPELILLKRSTSSLDELDFAVVGPDDRLVGVELKAKHQPYRGWSELWPTTPERELFILDELALRKIVGAGRYAYLVVADLPGRRWCLWSTAELVLATKVRTVRKLAATASRLKAKILLDLREAAVQVDDEHTAADALAEMLSASDQHWQAIEPWPHGPVVHNPFRRTS